MIAIVLAVANEITIPLELFIAVLIVFLTGLIGLITWIIRQIILMGRTNVELQTNQASLALTIESQHDRLKDLEAWRLIHLSNLGGKNG